MSYFMMQKSSQYTRSNTFTSEDSMATAMASNRWASSSGSPPSHPSAIPSTSSSCALRRGYGIQCNRIPYTDKPNPIPPYGTISEECANNEYTPGKPMNYVFKGRNNANVGGAGRRQRRGGGHQEQDCIDYRPFPLCSHDNESCTSTVISAITLPESLASVPEAEPIQKFCVRRKSGDADQDVRPRRPRRTVSIDDPETYNQPSGSPPCAA